MSFGLAADRQGDARGPCRAEDRRRRHLPDRVRAVEEPSGRGDQEPDLDPASLPRERREEWEERLDTCRRPRPWRPPYPRGVSRGEDLGGAQPLLRLDRLRNGRALPFAALGPQPGKAVQKRKLSRESRFQGPPHRAGHEVDRQAGPALVVRAGGQKNARPAREYSVNRGGVWW